MRQKKKKRAGDQMQATVSISRATWEQSKDVLKRSGFSRSRFVDLMLREIVRTADLKAGGIVNAFAATFERVMLEGLENLVKGEKKLRP
jgi:hypothetical protein